MSSSSQTRVQLVYRLCGIIFRTLFVCKLGTEAKHVSHLDACIHTLGGLYFQMLLSGEREREAPGERIEHIINKISQVKRLPSLFVPSVANSVTIYNHSRQGHELSPKDSEHSNSPRFVLKTCQYQGIRETPQNKTLPSTFHREI